MIHKIIHYFSHLFHLNKYDVISWVDNGYCFISLRCKECGKIDPPADKIKLTKEIENDYNDTNS